jgi:hypothetical protein
LGVVQTNDLLTRSAGVYHGILEYLRVMKVFMKVFMNLTLHADWHGTTRGSRTSGEATGPAGTILYQVLCVTGSLDTSR